MITKFSYLGGCAPRIEKQAGVNLSSLVSQGIAGAGKLMSHSGQAAKSLARKGVFNELGGAKSIVSGADRMAMRDMTAEAAKAVGNKRLSMAGKLTGAADSIAASPGMQKAINYGGAGALAGAGLYGSNRMGHASGLEEGVGSGLDTGMMAGVQAAQQNAAQQPQPGYLGGLWNAIKGDSGGAGINAGQTYGQLGQSRQALINQLMGRV